jgi:hypothetical protein
MARIAWLVPGLLEGSGGHRTILQHADYLQRQGHCCSLYIENHAGQSEASLKRDIRQMFGFDFEQIHSGWAQIEPADMAIATIWYSARVVRDFRFPCIKAYFVQDFEAQFNPVGDGYLMAENSYRYGLYPITIGRWLPALLLREFQAKASCFDFCADLDVYRKIPAIEKEKAICFIYQPDKPRRCAELGIEALGIVKHLMPDVKIYLYGSRAAGRVWFEHQNLGLLGLDACNNLYNRCTAGLCISSTNPSRIPFEMMAAGLPVVEVYRDNTIYDFPDSGMLLCEQTPESLARGLMDLVSTPDKAAAMGQAGKQFMEDRPIEQGLKQFLSSINLLLSGNYPSPSIPQRMYTRSALVAKPDTRTNELSGVHKATLILNRGRLAFLPSPLRKPIRAIYHRFRRLFS